MRLLLDTHVLIWVLTEPAKLPAALLALIRQRDTVRFVSAVTAWEVATKYRSGRLPEAETLVQAYAQHLRTFQATEIPITSRHALLAGSFTQPHRDPFDRLLVAQSIVEGIPLVSTDRTLGQFGATLMWDI